MKKSITLFLILAIFFLTTTHGFTQDHNLLNPNHWYSEECCAWHDCHPIADCSEIIDKADQGVSWMGFDFSSEQIRPSHDNQCHVCLHSYSGPNGTSDPRPICIYTPQHGS